mgnify:CR=1 FL=1
MTNQTEKMSENFSELVDKIVRQWRQAKNPVVFTGAGMSTESGLPDFRSAKGLWKFKPEQLATLDALRRVPHEFYRFYQSRIAQSLEVSPNIGHTILADLEKQGRIRTVITQNVDGLHQRAGSGSVIELHGTLRTVSCLQCGTEVDSKTMLPASMTSEKYSNAGSYEYGKECECSRCGGLLRPDVILFGESLPEQAWQDAVRASMNADFFIALGSSLLVSPANYCPRLAVENGARLLIINNDPTPLDDIATWVIHKPIGAVLADIAKRLCM